MAFGQHPQTKDKDEKEPTKGSHVQDKDKDKDSEEKGGKGGTVDHMITDPVAAVREAREAGGKSVQASNAKQAGPFIPVPGPSQKERLEALQRELQALKDRGIEVTSDKITVNGEQVSPPPEPKEGKEGAEPQAAVPSSTNVGAQLWDASYQGQSPRPAQPSIPYIEGGPQGVVYAPVGWVCSDQAGNFWVKSTDASVNTGWKKPTLA